MRYSVVDLFCGIGGLTKGLELAGLNVRAGLDMNETCRFAYETNNNSRFINANITQLTTDDLRELYPEDDLKILVGCAPCQPFSKYTKRYRKKGHNDDKWTLLYSFAKLIKNIKPKIVAMENVPDLSKESVFIDFITTLKREGYHCTWSIIFCPDYGVPQKRKRLILLASLLGDIKLIPPLYNPENYKTVRDTIEYLSPLTNGMIDQYDPMHCCAKLTEKNLQRIQQSVPGGTWHDWPESLRLNCHTKTTGYSYTSVYGRMEWDKPAPTITTQFYGYGNGRFGHPEQDRALSYREGALLQSFPNDYQFTPDDYHCKPHNIKLKDIGIHIGNAVPVELGRAIGVTIKNHLTQKESHKHTE